jgi:F420-dependent oxidoreductase-like protein
VTHPTRFGVTLPQIKRSWDECKAAAQAFDQQGYDSVWVCDHVYGVPLPTLPILEAWTLLAAVAAVTDHVELGTLVSPPFFRNPGVFAKQITTVDHISGGRAIAGLGAGWFTPEFEGYGNPFPELRERMRALEETCQILKGLWTEERFDFDGRHFQMKQAIAEPKPVRRPPILVGGGGEKVLMGIVAKHADIWNNMAVSQHELAAKVAALRRRCDELKRDFETLRVSQQCVVVIAETEDEAKKSLEKAQKVYGGHLGAHLAEHGIWGHPDRVVDCIERHRKDGCSDFLMEFFGRDTREPAALFAETVKPHFAS